MVGSVLVRWASEVAEYENAPLRYVVFAVELRSVSVLGERTAVDRVHEALRDLLPVREDIPDSLLPGPEGTGLIRSPATRFVDGQQHRALLVAPSRVAIDTTTYSTFSEFTAFVGRAFDA